MKTTTTSLRFGEHPYPTGAAKATLVARQQAGRRRVAHPNSLKDECPAGHPYDDENTYRDPSGARRCRRCNAARQRRMA